MVEGKGHYIYQVSIIGLFLRDEFEHYHKQINNVY